MPGFVFHHNRTLRSPHLQNSNHSEEIKMPSTRNRSRSSEHSVNTDFATSDFVKKGHSTRVKRCKLKSKKPVHSKKLTEQLDEQNEGML